MGEIPETSVNQGYVPWHKAGTVVDDVMTARDCLVLAGLDWDVELQPVYVNASTELDTAEHYMEVEGKVAVVRKTDGRVFEIVSERYEEMQNRKAFDFFDQVIGNDEAKYTSAGALKGGAHIYISAKLTSDVLVGGVDTVEFYVVMTTSHDGSLAFQMMNTPNRPLCRNTLNLAISTATQVIKLRHTTGLEDQVEQAKMALGFAQDYRTEFEKVANQLIDADFAMRDFEQMMRDVFPGKQSGKFSAENYSMIGVFESTPTLDDEYRYTKWGALNAIREWDDWGKDIRTANDAQSEAETRCQRAWFGPGVKRSNESLKYLLAH